MLKKNPRERPSALEALDLIPAFIAKEKGDTVGF